MINGNVLLVRPVRPFQLIAGLTATWYQVENVWPYRRSRSSLRRRLCQVRPP